ncbi:MAG: NapC/NirT family cytochrome c [Candidatus Acidiferrales bacterium]
MLGLSGILIALIVLSMVVAIVFLIRPGMTIGPREKILAFMGLFILPVLCVGGGMSEHMQRSEQTRFCISCHAMEPYGKSLYVDDPKYIPAQHFQNHRVPPDMACYSCHTDYTIYGPVKDKLKGLTRIYMQYVSTPPNPITIPGGFKNAQCLHCHAGARGFEQNPVHSAMMSSLVSNQLSCISSGCHDAVHDASDVEHLKMWRPGQ